MILNKSLPILFLGLGGAGQRQLRIIRGLLPENPFFAFRFTKKTPLLNQDFSINSKSSIEEKYKIEVLKNINDIKKINPFLTVISLPTSMHSKYSLNAHKIGSNVFVEKPGFFNNEEINILKNEFINSKLKYMVGFQRQFNPSIKLLKNILKSGDLGKISKVFVKVSSFIPSWHPYENYKELYACKKNLGGGILHTECHELFLLSSLFGCHRYCKKKLFSSYAHELDVSDSCELEIGYDDFKVYCDISFIREPNERVLEFEMELGTIKLDLNSNNIIIYKNKNLIEEKKFNFSSDFLFELQAKSVLKLEYDNKITFSRLEALGKIIN